MERLSYREIFHLLIHSPKGWSFIVGRIWSQNAEVLRALSCECWGTKIWTLFCFVPKPLESSWFSSGAAWRAAGILRGSQYFGRGIAYFATTPAPSINHLHLIIFRILFLSIKFEKGNFVWHLGEVHIHQTRKCVSKTCKMCNMEKTIKKPRGLFANLQKVK